ncbi:DUF4389 domain-containing protein [Parvibaculum sedimenti]|uniref:DUF4389 domain-containing protein n=2 Tax=Parvibaculum sedimenti TaxID=2608632 RepID=A0A6N6VHM4_9HYPH|nr:DUF4389 domain-containing protein [Parvibaculum sedimenti]KAB7739223.1 DUF4389 domain-containing protein [Parvibaculum sedimenti]
MSDTSSAPSEVTAQEPLWLRFIYMIAYALLAHVAFSLALFLGVVQLVVILATKEKNEELRNFSRNLVQYVGECLSFVIFAREEKPFPFGKFPVVTPPQE